MERFRDILLQVWRETCRHIALSESLATVLPALAERLPLTALLIRHLDAEHAALETVGVAGALDPMPAGRTPLKPDELKRLLAWLRRGRILRCDRRLTDEARLLVPEALRSRRILAAPLGAPGGASGALLLVARETTDFAARHEELVAALREPFGVALENDRRLHEIAVLREAAEADKRALLGRLGRREVGGDRIVGLEGGLRGVMERVQQVARSDAPVLILGETGTGKEVVARAIHTRSTRADGPFLRVNCGAIPPELIDSQLFGHERGSFTGAVDTHQGWFERADKGTLFLDEIGELPAAAQVRFLRVLQDGLIERVGGRQSIPVDVRIVAATHRDLPAMVAAGQFRKDLWYRINVFPIDLPPLRERPEDISEMSRHFAERAATRFGLTVTMPTADDIRLLLKYDWPGNVRELGAVIDRAALLGDGRRLEIAKALGSEAPSAQPTAPRIAAGPAEPGPLQAGSPLGVSAADSLDDAMRQHIKQALQATFGRIEGPFGAARRLGINPHTLRARMRKLRIDWRGFRAR